MKKEFLQILGLQVLFVLALICFAVCTQAWGADGPITYLEPTSCHDCSDEVNAAIDNDLRYGIFTSSSAAHDFIANVAGSYGGCGGCGCGYSDFGGSCGNKVRYYRCSCTCNGVSTQFRGYYDNGTCTVEDGLPYWNDSDGDGLINSIDPWPSDDQPFTWKRFAYCTDSSEEIQQFTIRAQRADGQVKYMSFGDNSTCVNDEMDLWTSTHEGSLLANYFSSGGEYASFAEEIQDDFGGMSLDYDPGTGSGFTSGTDDSGNSTDSDRLSDIVNNTKSAADNVARLGDYLQGIGESIEGLNETVAGSSGGIAVVGGSSSTEGGVSSEDIETGVDGAIQDAEGRADDELTDGLSGLPGSYDFTDEGSITGNEDEFGPMNSKIGDTDSNGVADGIDSIRNSIGSNNLVDALQNSGVQLSGAECLLSMDTVIFGNVELDFCEWASAFDTIGNYTVALSWMVFMMIVFL
jgi:hypothetical protein